MKVMLMTSIGSRLWTLAIVVMAATSCGAADEPLTRVQLARLGKAATAFVDVKATQGQGSGTAFCIHPDGWFLTNAHVAQGELTLVLDPALASQKAYSARVVRSDSELDLALLRIEGARGLPALELGSDEGLEELTEVIGFGFPFGKVIDGREYPAVSVNVGSINALRHKDGRLHRIQLDAAVTRGNSGGPVLDQRGKVIGVIVSGVIGTEVNFAIPVSAVKRFLERPEVQFTPPRLGAGELHKPVRFEARVTPLLPSKDRLTVELILKAGNGPERTARMEADGDRYSLTTVPIPGTREPRTLRLVARFENATLEATTTDRSFTIGGREVALGDVRSIFPGSPSRVVLRSGETITGALVGLETVPALLSGQSLTVDLTSAREVTFRPVGQGERVACTLVVRHGENETFRKSQSLSGAESVKLVEISRLNGHQDAQNAVVSPDGRRILSCGWHDRTMILWDRETGRMIRRYGQQGGVKFSVAISPDGRRALSGSEDAVLRLWDLESGDVIREFRGHTGWIFSTAFSPDGRLAYSASGGRYNGSPVWQELPDSAIRVWDVETGREVRRLEGHRGLVWCVRVSPDGRRVLTGGSDGVAIVWDAETGTEVRRLHGHTDKVDSVAFLPDGRRAVSCSWDKTVRLWDPESGSELHAFTGHAREVTWVAVSPDGRLMLSSDYQGHDLRLWDLEGRKLIQRVDWGNVSPTRGCFTPDGLNAVWAGTDGVVRMYQLQPDESGTSDNLNGSPGPDISGRWFCYGRPCYITRTGPGTFDFRNEDGGVHPSGRLVSRTEIDAWEMKGTIREVGGRTIIAWSNGTEWVRDAAASAGNP
jgi:WD40 repeat protein